MVRFAWIGGAVMAFLTVLTFLQNRLIYFPEKELGAPGTYGLAGVEEVAFAAADGPRLWSWFLPPPGPGTPTVLFFSGNAGNISHRAARVWRARAEGWGLLLLGYRGYGRSEGSPGESGLYQDARAALAWLRGRPDVDPSRIVYHGESLGSAVALELAVAEPPRALILEAPFESLRAVASVHYPLLPVSLLLRSRFDNLERIADLRAPLLVLHGEDDRIVPVAQGRAVFAAAPEPKRFVAVDAGHNDLWAEGGATVAAAVREFLDAAVR